MSYHASIFLLISCAPTNILTIILLFLLLSINTDIIPLSVDITTMLDHNEIHIIPITNPDGRIEAQKGVLWRKNNNNNHCGSGQQWTGVDLNRNFPYEWGAPGSSNTKCKQTYRGPSPESEPETKAVLNYLDTILPPNQRVLGSGGINSRFSDPDTTTGMALDIHSYSELILYPWGFVSTIHHFIQCPT